MTEKAVEKIAERILIEHRDTNKHHSQGTCLECIEKAINKGYKLGYKSGVEDGALGLVDREALCKKK